MHRFAIRRAVVTLVFVAIPLCGMQQSVRADTESPRVVLGPGAKDLIVEPKMNAAGKDLRGCQFITLDLSGAVFDGCCLYGARIDNCILRGASFRGAIFTGADVEVGLDDGADFTDATINGAWRASAGGFRSYGAQLSPRQLMSTWSYKNKDLRQCSIIGSRSTPLDFRGADLREANLAGDFSTSDFTNAHIYGVSLPGDRGMTFAQLASTLDFKQRRLRVYLSFVRGTGVGSSEKWDFSRINLEGSNLVYPPSDAVFVNAKVNGCTIRNGLTRSQLYSTASYKQGDLAGLQLFSSDLSGCDLSGMNLTGCLFSNCKFAGTNFDDAVISRAWFVTAEADRLTVEQIKKTWNYKHGNMKGIRLPDDIAKALEQIEIKGRSANKKGSK